MLHFLTAGESHGRGVIGVVESFPAGFEISVDAINRQLARRQHGYGRGKRMEIEKDRVQIISGLRNGLSLGSPISGLINNKDWPNWKS
jgi:chorismate synthase